MGLLASWHVESSWTRDRTHVPCIGRWILPHCATRQVQRQTCMKPYVSTTHIQLFATPWNSMEYSPWSSPGQNTGAGSLSLLQGIFLTQESNPGLPHCRQVLYQLSQREAQNTTEGCLLTHGLISSPAQTYKADFLFCSWRRWSMGMFIVSFKVMGTLMRR